MCFVMVELWHTFHLDSIRTVLKKCHLKNRCNILFAEETASLRSIFLLPWEYCDISASADVSLFISSPSIHTSETLLRSNKQLSTFLAGPSSPRYKRHTAVDLGLKWSPLPLSMPGRWNKIGGISKSSATFSSILSHHFIVKSVVTFFLQAKSISMWNVLSEMNWPPYMQIQCSQISKRSILYEFPHYKDKNILYVC